MCIRDSPNPTQPEQEMEAMTGDQPTEPTQKEDLSTQAMFRRMITSIEKTESRTKGTTSGMNIIIRLISMYHTIIHKTIIGITAVSYTHLDVYKRQVVMT